MPPKGAFDVVIEVLDSGRTPEEVCGDDAALLAVVKDRLKRYEQIHTQLDDLFPPMVQQRSATATPREDRLPRIAGYEVRSVLGRGGIGVVYEAKHLTLGRPVALKMLLAGDFATGQEMLRFTREAKSIAALRHPHIVQIFDFGEHEGRPFFTMELLEGGSLREKLAGKAILPGEAAETVATLALAVEAAHGAGIVHRDLKPANILRTANGTLKISDFGLAFQAEDLSITQIGEPLGTPSYMAPEQAAGMAEAHSPAVDIYSLGALLYEALTGRPPFLGTTSADTRRRVINELPLPPSRLQAGVPRDLDIITCKCLEKEPHRRYASAAELAADLQRYLRHEPIKARPISWPGHAVRWRRRHPGVAAALASVALLIMVLIVGSLLATAYFRTLERQQSQLAREKSRLAEANDIARGIAVQAQKNEAVLRTQAEDKEKQLRRTLYFAQMNLGGQAAVSPSGLGRVQQWLAGWDSSTPDVRNWEWYYLNSLCHRDLRTLRGHVAGVCDIVRNPDGSRLASAGADGQVMVWDPSTGQRLLTLKGHVRDVVVVAWSPDGQKIASASSDGTIFVWNAQSGVALRTIAGTPCSARTLTWNPQSDRLASAGDGQAISVWDAATGAKTASIGDIPKGFRAAAWSPDGRVIAAGGPDFNIYLFDPTTGTLLKTLRGHANFVTDLAWSPDGSRLASASNDNLIKLWDGQTGEGLQSFSGHSNGVTRVVWSPDAQRIASSSFDHCVKIWSVASGKAFCTYRGHTLPATGVAWTADGTLASSSFDGTVKIWPAQPREEMAALPTDIDGTRAAVWSHDGQWLAAEDKNNTISIWNVSTCERRTILSGATDVVNAIAWSPDDVRLAAAGEGQAVHVWDIDSGKMTATLPARAVVRALAWSQDGRLASGGDDAIIRLWDIEHGREANQLTGHSAAIRSLCWSADCALLASGSNDTTVKIWDANAGTLSTTLTGHTAGVTTVAWSTDLHRLASGGEDQTIRIWDPISANLLATLTGHTTTVTSIAWNPDNSRLASASEDHTLKVWDAASGNVALTLLTGESVISVVAWSPDGMKLAAAGDHRFLQIYDASLGYLAAKSPKYLSVLNQYLQRNATDVSAWQDLASIRAQHQQWDEAAAAAKRCLELDHDRSWLVEGFWIAGPFPDAIDASFGPEGDSDPSHLINPAAKSTDDEPIAWQSAPYNQDGFANLSPLFRHEPHYSAYALLRVFSTSVQRVSAVIEGPPPMRVWENNKVVYNASQPADQSSPLAFPISISLQPGWNSLLARVPGENDECSLHIELKSLKGETP